MSAQHETVILGLGVTGLAPGMASSSSVFEGREVTGGLCASCYVRPGDALGGVVGGL